LLIPFGLLVFAQLQDHPHSLPRFFAGNTQRRCVALCRKNFFSEDRHRHKTTGNAKRYREIYFKILKKRKDIKEVVGQKTNGRKYAILFGFYDSTLRQRRQQLLYAWTNVGMKYRSMKEQSPGYYLIISVGFLRGPA
jgi:hypothetical protein